MAEGLDPGSGQQDCASHSRHRWAGSEVGPGHGLKAAMGADLRRRRIRSLEPHPKDGLQAREAVAMGTRNPMEKSEGFCPTS